MSPKPIEVIAKPRTASSANALEKPNAFTCMSNSQEVEEKTSSVFTVPAKPATFIKVASRP